MHDRVWVEKYRPSDISAFIFKQDSIKRTIKQMIDKKNIPNLLFVGSPGTGKTTLARIIIQELAINSIDLMVINGSDDNSVEMARSLKPFITSMALGSIKIILIEEADYLTPNSQAALRQMMEDYTDVVRFILTCNYGHKIIPALKSRCQTFVFDDLDKVEMAKAAVDILKNECVEHKIEHVFEVIEMTYPDMRATVNTLQKCCINKKLIAPTEDFKKNDFGMFLLEHIECDNWDKVREGVCENVMNDEWEDLYKFLYNNLNKSKKFGDMVLWKQGIIIIAEHLYKHSLCADPEINFSAMLIRLSLVEHD